MEMILAIQIKNLTKKFDGQTVIEDLSIDFEVGKITSILAPSGAGKTTLLRLIAGLDRPTSGKILINGNEVGETPTNLGFMFQENSTFSWLTVRENVEFGLNLASHKNVVKNEKGARVNNITRDTGIDKFLDFYPSQLSGGQKQRVVIARSLVLNPSIILCDEPFSSLDEFSRKELRELILQIQKRYAQTIVFITHNTEEADFLGDYILVCSASPMKIIEIRKQDFRNKNINSLK